MVRGERIAVSVGFGNVELTEMERSEVGACTSGSKGRGERRVEIDGVSRREETWGDVGEPLLGRVDVGVVGEEES